MAVHRVALLEAIGTLRACCRSACKPVREPASPSGSCWRRMCWRPGPLERVLPGPQHRRLQNDLESDAGQRIGSFALPQRFRGLHQGRNAQPWVRRPDKLIWDINS